MPDHRRHRHRREEPIREQTINNEQPTNKEQPNPFSNMLGNINISSIASLINSIDINELAASINNNNYASVEEGVQLDEGTRRKNDIANALKTLINCDKSELVQVLLRFYALRNSNKK